jgi:hypothetical protein
VVAVDSRWLSNSSLASTRVWPARRVTAAPPLATISRRSSRYLLGPAPLAESDRRHLVHGLLERNLLHRPARTTSAATGVPASDPLTVNPAEEQVIYAMLRAPGRPHAATETLAITRQELDFFDELAPLLGDTPRTVKRLVNAYQLLTAMPGVRANGQQSPGATLIVALLVAMNGGLPRLAPRLFQLVRQYIVPNGSGARPWQRLTEASDLSADCQQRSHTWPRVAPRRLVPQPRRTGLIWCGARRWRAA